MELKCCFPFSRLPNPFIMSYHASFPPSWRIDEGRELPNELEEDFEIEDPAQELFRACEKVLRAGIWLIRNGYGHLAILPYLSPSGCHWRCEFHPVGFRSRTIFRYSSADGHKYLASHCGGTLRKDASPEKLAKAALVGADEDLLAACSGEAPPETLAWLETLERVLAQQFVPHAFHEYSDDPATWTVETPNSDMKSSIPAPPWNWEEDLSWKDLPFWRAALARWESRSGCGPLVFDPVSVGRNAADDVFVDEFRKAAKFATIWEIPDLVRASFGNLIHLSSVASVSPGTPVLPVSQSPAQDPATRRACRVLAMAHELHKAGYQRLRIAPGYSADGREWRCVLASADNVGSEGWIPGSSGYSASYETKQGNKFFGWTDAGEDDARKLAAKFVERFPELARASAGRDWTYAGWLSTVLGQVENGRLPALYSGKDFFPEPQDTPAPPPSAWSIAHGDVGLVANADLALSDLPPPESDYERLWPFCLTYDGYHGGLWGEADLAHVYGAVLSAPLGESSMDALRAAAYYAQRYIKHNSEMLYADPPSEKLQRLLADIRAVVEELRKRLR